MTRVIVPSLAKLNLHLRVLYKRLDGYHELRTIFQTVSLHDTLTIDFEPGKRSSIELNSSTDIPDNLVLRAAHLTADELKIRASLRIWLKKKIPMGAGLGGGSSNAAAVLIALTALAGKPVPLSELVRLGEQLGSDVPFFYMAVPRSVWDGALNSIHCRTSRLARPSLFQLVFTYQQPKLTRY